MEITEAQRQLCAEIMARNEFCYAHLDLLVTSENKTYLGEINLRGGLRGASITAREYRRRMAEIDTRRAEELLASQQ